MVCEAEQDALTIAIEADEAAADALAAAETNLDQAEAQQELAATQKMISAAQVMLAQQDLINCQNQQPIQQSSKTASSPAQLIGCSIASTMLAFSSRKKCRKLARAMRLAGLEDVARAMVNELIESP